MVEEYKEEMIALSVLPNGALQVMFPVKKTYALFDPEIDVEMIVAALSLRVDFWVLEHLRRKWPEILEKIRGTGPIVFVGTQGVVKQKGKFQVIG